MALSLKEELLEHPQLLTKKLPTHTHTHTFKDFKQAKIFFSRTHTAEKSLVNVFNS